MKSFQRVIAMLLLLLSAVCGEPPPGSLAQERSADSRIFEFPPPSKVHRVAEPKLVPLGEAIPDWKARWELARLLSYVKRYDESIVAYGRVLSEKPDLFEARAELANVLVWSGLRKEALKVFEQIPVEKLNDRDRLVLGDIYAVDKQYDRAAAAYRSHLDSRPDAHDVRLRLAEVLSWQKNYDASLSEYRKLLDALPDDVQVRRKFAFVLSWAGRRGEAIAELKKTLTD